MNQQEEKKKDSLAQIEAKAVRFVELGDAISRFQEERELLKESIGQLMKEEHMGEYRVGLNESYDIKIAVGEKVTQKMDYEALANDLGISETAAKEKETLIKAVQEGRLTLEQYLNYKYNEVKECVNIRKVKPL